MSMYESAEEQALAAAELLGAELEYDPDDPASWSLQLSIEPNERQHRVFLFPIEETDRSLVHMAEEPGFVCASAIVGPLNERVDLNFCLESAAHMFFARVTIREIDGQDTVMVEGIQDDALTLAENGYRVIIDQKANSDTFLPALYNDDEDLAGAETAGFLWSSHGDKRGRVQTHDGRWFSCKLVVPERTSQMLRCAIFSACHVGAWEKHWKVSLPEVKIYAWGKPVSFNKALEFYTPDEATTTGLDDILERELSLPKGSIAATYQRLQSGEEFVVTTAPDDERTSAMADDSLGSMVNDALALLEYDIVEGPFQIDGNPHYNVVLKFGDVRKQRLDLLYGAGNPHTDRFDEDDDQYLYVQSIVGPMTGVIDPALILGAASGMTMARVQVVDTDPPQLMVQGALPDVTVLPETLAFLVEEVASLADNLEEQIFGCDED